MSAPDRQIYSEAMRTQVNSPILLLGDTSFIATILRTSPFSESIYFCSMRDHVEWKRFCLVNKEIGVSIIWCIKTKNCHDEINLLRQCFDFLGQTLVPYNFIYLSSFAVYRQGKRVSENRVIEPTSNYGKIKLACESFLSNVVLETALSNKVICLRLSSFYDQCCADSGITPYVTYISENVPCTDSKFVFECYGKDDLMQSVSEALSTRDDLPQYSVQDVYHVIKWSALGSGNQTLRGVVFWKLVIPLAWMLVRILPGRLRRFLGLFTSQ